MSKVACTQCGDHNTIPIEGSFIPDGVEMPSGKPTKTGWVRRECCWCGYHFNERVDFTQEETDG